MSNMEDGTIVLLGLPRELFGVIFAFLPVDDLGRLRRVCKDFHEVIAKSFPLIKQWEEPMWTSWVDGHAYVHKYFFVTSPISATLAVRHLEGVDAGERIVFVVTRLRLRCPLAIPKDADSDGVHRVGTMDKFSHHFKVDRKMRQTINAGLDPAMAYGIMYCPELTPGVYEVSVRGGFHQFIKPSLKFSATLDMAFTPPSEHHTTIKDARREETVHVQYKPSVSDEGAPVMARLSEVEADTGNQ